MYWERRWRRWQKRYNERHERRKRCWEGRDDEDEGRVGNGQSRLLQPISGSLKYYGQQSLWGFLSGLAYKADAKPKTGVKTGKTTVSVGDVDFELYVRDSKFKQATAQKLATNFVKDQNVDMLFGCASSSSATTVIKTVAKTAGVPYIAGPAASADITSNGETCNNLVFRASENTAMDARSGGKYVAKQTDVKKVYLFGADYSFGKAVVNNYEHVLKDGGVEIVGKKFVPQGHSEWKGLLDNAEKAGAQGIVGGFTVATLRGTGERTGRVGRRRLFSRGRNGLHVGGNGARLARGTVVSLLFRIANVRTGEQGAKREGPSGRVFLVRLFGFAVRLARFVSRPPPVDS